MISAHFSMPFTAVQRDMIVEFMVGLVNQIAGDQEGQDIRQRHGVQHTVQPENRGSSRAKPTPNTTSRTMERAVDSAVMPTTMEMTIWKNFITMPTTAIGIGYYLKTKTA